MGRDARDGFGGSVPIGRPIAGTRLLLLDDCGRTVPTGVPGAIHVGGPGVVSGYLKGTEPERSPFVSAPDDSTALLYATGDQGVWLDDGDLLFLGRDDRQVKSRHLADLVGPGAGCHDDLFCTKRALVRADLPFAVAELFQSFNARVAENARSAISRALGHGVGGLAWVDMSVERFVDRANDPVGFHEGIDFFQFVR